MRFLCIADEDTARGFRLAGVESVVVADGRQAAQAFSAAVAREDCGLVFIPHRIAELIRPQIAQLCLERLTPLVAEIDDVAAGWKLVEEGAPWRR